MLLLGLSLGGWSDKGRSNGVAGWKKSERGNGPCGSGSGSTGGSGSGSSVRQPSAEICDGIDNNCDNIVDNGTLPGTGGACDGPDADLCKEGIIVCSNGQLVCSDNRLPAIGALEDGWDGAAPGVGALAGALVAGDSGHDPLCCCTSAGGCGGAAGGGGANGSRPTSSVDSRWAYSRRLLGVREGCPGGKSGL